LAVSDETELTEWKPKYPRVKAIGDFLRTVGESSAIGKFLLEGKANLADLIAYDQPLTTGKNQTLRGKPEILEAADFIPGGSTIKGVGAVGAIGPVGIRFLGDANIIRRARDLAEVLRKTKPTDWKLQKDIIEDAPGFFPIPRGRDFDFSTAKRLGEDKVHVPEHARFGYELPEGKLLTADSEDFAGLYQKTNPARDNWRTGIQDVYDHPRLYKAYPRLKEYEVSYNPSANLDSGVFSAGDKAIGLGPQSSPKDLLSTLNHEIAGHYVQHAEGWPGGTNSSWAARQLRKIPKDAILEKGEVLPAVMERQRGLAKLLHQADAVGDKREMTAVPYIGYRREAGEQMANAIAKSAERGGGKIPHSYTTPYSLMYDERDLEQTLAHYWEEKLLEGLDPKIFGGVPNKR
jgi:hypothetical protein